MNAKTINNTVPKQLLRTAIAALLGGALSAALPASAAISSLNLGNYTLTATYNLPAAAASEASAVTYNWNTGTLFVLGDEGDALVEVSKTGQQLSVMSLSGFDDTEGLTYIGNGQFVLTEERLRDAYKLTYVAGGSASRSSLLNADLGTTVGNIGIEGISYDPRDGSFITVKEKSLQEVKKNQLTFGKPGTSTSVNLFTPNLGVLDLSDVQVLATVPSLAGTADADNLLIFSQESSRLLEVDRLGNILSQFDFSRYSSSAEGVTIDSDGNIYIVDEGPHLFALTPTAVPVPAAAWLFGGALTTLAGVARRRNARSS